MFKANQIVPFLRVFEKEDFIFSVIHPPVERDGFWTHAHDELSKPALDFIQALYKSGAIDPKFLDRTVISDERSYRLRNDNDEIKSASLFELAHVLTFLTRAERFTPGTITSAYNSGLIIRILKRLSVLVQSET